MPPLYVAIVWHMHQPYYKDLRTGDIPLPWVRLHAAKDYLHMAEVLAKHPQVHLTINLVPSLVEQMLDWAEGREKDTLAQVAEMETWDDDHRRFMLSLCFSISWDKIIRRHPRYAELLNRRPAALAAPAAFTDADYRDLVTWFNLAWIDPNWLERDPTLSALVAKGRDYTLDDVRAVHAKQREIAGRVLPLYRQLVRGGQLEVSVSPYFHPILPLLIDTDCARRPSPGLPLPDPAFRAPEDVAAQLALAVEAHTAHFGTPPRGLWPSEGAVSPEILPFVRAAGFTWLASGETILARSLGYNLDRDSNGLLTNPRALYQPYRVLAGSELGPHIVFRDQELADRIGFLYQHLPGVQGAEDMIYRLLEIRRRINDPSSPYLVSIILDGENCWEHFEHNGDDFLNTFYGELERRPELQAVSVGEFIEGRRPAATLARLATGSWIGGDLTTWIGDPEHEKAWDALRRAREHLASRATPPGSRADGQSSTPRPDQLAAARHALHAAEGSDWFWWYSHRNSSDQDALFDRLFRHALTRVYESLGDEPPAWLFEPIQQAAQATDYRPATGYITPPLTAAPYPGEAWAKAASLRPAAASTGTMQRAAGIIERLFVGHDPARLYLRLDLRQSIDEFDTLIYLGDATDRPANQRVDARFLDPDDAPRELIAQWLIRRDASQAAPFLYRADGRAGWRAEGPLQAAIGERSFEASVSLETLGYSLNDEIRIYMVLAHGGQVSAALPERKMATLKLPEFSTKP